MSHKITINKKHYTIEPVAEGGFVDIYRGVGEKDSSDVRLVKIIKESYLDNQRIQQRFEQEYAVLNSLAEEPFFFAKQACFGQIDERHFLSYSFIEGTTVLQRLKNWSARSYSALACCGIMEQILGALNVLHDREAPVVHSDLSPENLIVSGNHVYLIDMGCAQTLDDQSPLASRWVGKPSYLSPEQARGDEWSTQSDLFQAGIVFYELLTGTRWNSGSSPQQKKIFAANPPPTNFTPLPVEVRPILRSLLNTEPNHRIHSTSLCLRRLQFARRALEKRIR